MGSVIEFIEDAWDDVTDFVEEDIFGAPSDEDIANQEADANAAAALAAGGKPQDALDIRTERKDKLAGIRAQREMEKAGELATQKGKSAGIVAGLRGGSGGISSSKGAAKSKIRAQKFKSSRPLKLGMKRP